MYASDRFTAKALKFQSNMVSLTVKVCDRTFEADLKQVSTVPVQYLKLPGPPKKLMEIRSRYPHIKDVKLVDVGEPTILSLFVKWQSNQIELKEVADVSSSQYQSYL
ncbi:hypothetical protein OUZ56_010076 [Daphnia magna]|uniref:Uncharacterized protein n=1 Tax=Daphnia magna TaxID=35525 RepID=A0ABR0AHT8_9CRUS|nr:hypothetical protein OUZ56_010076 [Daphnia magna]